MSTLPRHVYGRIQTALEAFEREQPDGPTQVDVVVDVVVAYMDEQTVAAVLKEQEHTEAAESVSEKLRTFIAQGITAFHHTREYVGEDVLPAQPGWSWFDWTERAHTIIRREDEHATPR
jgi:uncharacterized circularly permuted ATP-grasp superfamily protein